MSPSPQSRIWIYQADRNLSDAEVSICRKELSAFIPGWTAHDQLLTAGFDVRYNRFIILWVDETQAGASGCSIDKSVREIKKLEQMLSINLFNRLDIARLQEDGTIASASREQMSELLEQGIINAGTKVFNNTVQTLAEFESSWIIPYSESWAYPRTAS